MKLHRLEADRPLCKTISGDVIRPYPMVSRFTSHEHNPSDLSGFEQVLRLAAGNGHCLLKGPLTEPLVNTSRRGKHDRSAPTSWVCLDFDGLDIDSPAEAMELFGIDRVSYIVQQSASAGIRPGLRCHIFFLLADPVSPAQLKIWLTWLNLSIPKMRLGLSLNRTHDGLRYPLDITVCQNDKLIYVAPPILEGPDPIPERITTVTRATDYYVLDLKPALSANILPRRAELISDLRAEIGLRRRVFKLRQFKNTPTLVVSNPEPASTYEYRIDGPFTRLNLNGGDSWAYWHPTANPRVLYSFKDEDSAYRMQDILPQYLEEARDNAAKAAEDMQLQEAPPPVEQATPQRPPEHTVQFVFSDQNSGHYTTVHYEPADRSLTFMQCRGRQQLEDFCTLNNLPAPDAVPQWRRIFNPKTYRIFDNDHCTINLYRPSDYVVNADLSRYHALPHLYRRLFLHALGGHKPSLTAFTHWLGYMLQLGEKPKTAWLLHGVEGTGKGRLFDVLKELFGAHQAVRITTNRLTDQFNALLQNTQLLFLDEISMDNQGLSSIEDQLKNLITEPELGIRAMRTDLRLVPSYLGIIAAANEENAIHVSTTDRRWHVPPRQEQRLFLDDEEYEAVLDPEQLQLLANHLLTMTVDTKLVMHPAATEAKSTLQTTTMKVPRLVVDRLKDGDFDFFLRQVPIGTDAVTGSNADLLFQYKKILTYIFEQLSQHALNTQIPVSLVREELRVIFATVAGWEMQVGEKFSAAAARFGLNLRNSRVIRSDLDENTPFIGMSFPFTLTEEAKVYYLQHIAKAPLKAVHPTDRLKRA